MKKNNLPRGLRNNNPGNIRINGDLFQGEVRPSKDKSFKQFETMAYGYRAMFVILRNYIRNYKLDTIRKMISRWAPTNENHTENYIRVVAERSGILADELVYPENREIMIRIVAAMSYVENGVEADMPDVITGDGFCYETLSCNTDFDSLPSLLPGRPVHEESRGQTCLQNRYIRPC